MHVVPKVVHFDVGAGGLGDDFPLSPLPHAIAIMQARMTNRKRLRRRFDPLNMVSRVHN